MTKGNSSINIKGMPLFKFQSANRIESLRAGHLYAKTLKYYRDLEITTGDAEIGDKYEAMLHFQNATAQFSTPDGNHVIPLNDTLLSTSSSDDFVFCMFSINDVSEEFHFSEKQKENLLSFGDTALIILDSEEFKRRVFEAAKKQGYSVHFDRVKYYDSTIDNADILLSLFGGMWNAALWKRDSYSHQQESRFIFSPGKGDDHVVLEIGDISDITVVRPTKSILSANVVPREE